MLPTRIPPTHINLFPLPYFESSRSRPRRFYSPSPYINPSAAPFLLLIRHYHLFKLFLFILISIPRANLLAASHAHRPSSLLRLLQQPGTAIVLSFGVFSVLFILLLFSFFPAIVLVYRSFAMLDSFEFPQLLFILLFDFFRPNLRNGVLNRKFQINLIRACNVCLE
jgi:hypothetical protein